MRMQVISLGNYSIENTTLYLEVKEEGISLYTYIGRLKVTVPFIPDASSFKVEFDK